MLPFLIPCTINAGNWHTYLLLEPENNTGREAFLAKHAVFFISDSSKQHTVGYLHDRVPLP